jgi:hypothetical protein
MLWGAGSVLARRRFETFFQYIRFSRNGADGESGAPAVAEGCAPQVGWGDPKTAVCLKRGE